MQSVVITRGNWKHSTQPRCTLVANQRLGSRRLCEMPRAGSNNGGQAAREVAQWRGLPGHWRGMVGRLPAARGECKPQPQP